MKYFYFFILLLIQLFKINSKTAETILDESYTLPENLDEKYIQRQKISVGENIAILSVKYCTS